MKFTVALVAILLSASSVAAQTVNGNVVSRAIRAIAASGCFNTATNLDAPKTVDGVVVFPSSWSKEEMASWLWLGSNVSTEVRYASTKKCKQ